MNLPLNPGQTRALVFAWLCVPLFVGAVFTPWPYCLIPLITMLASSVSAGIQWDRHTPQS